MEKNFRQFEQPIEKKDKKRIQDIIKFRFNQTDSSKLAEYITGLRPDNPQMRDRLIEDQKIIRGKYGLPAFDAEYDPAEYERFLKDLAKRYKIKIRKPLEFQRLFKEKKDDFIGAMYLEGTNQVVADMREQYYLNDIRQLEHELIHAMQETKSPRMPIEMQEYEAYIANFNVESFKGYPEMIENFFEFFIGSSLNYYYDQIKKDDQYFEPEWKNPEFFLKNIDQINNKNIKEYRNKKSFLKKIISK